MLHLRYCEVHRSKPQLMKPQRKDNLDKYWMKMKPQGPSVKEMVSNDVTLNKTRNWKWQKINRYKNSLSSEINVDHYLTNYNTNTEILLK